MIHRFYWLIEDCLAGCSLPGNPQSASRAATASNSTELERDLAWLDQRGIQSVLTLTESSLDANTLGRAGMHALHIAIPDLHPPRPEQFASALRFIDTQRASGRAVAVHCLMGQGRTGTILAGYLIRAGMQTQDAIRTIRELCPHSIESPEQESALFAFSRRRDWIL